MTASDVHRLGGLNSKAGNVSKLSALLMARLLAPTSCVAQQFGARSRSLRQDGDF